MISENYKHNDIIETFTCKLNLREKLKSIIKQCTINLNFTRQHQREKREKSLEELGLVRRTQPYTSSYYLEQDGVRALYSITSSPRRPGNDLPGLQRGPLHR